MNKTLTNPNIWRLRIDTSALSIQGVRLPNQSAFKAIDDKVMQLVALGQRPNTSDVVEMLKQYNKQHILDANVHHHTILGVHVPKAAWNAIYAVAHRQVLDYGWRPDAQDIKHLLHIYFYPAEAVLELLKQEHLTTTRAVKFNDAHQLIRGIKVPNNYQQIKKLIQQSTQKPTRAGVKAMASASSHVFDVLSSFMDEQAKQVVEISSSVKK